MKKHLLIAAVMVVGSGCFAADSYAAPHRAIKQTAEKRSDRKNTVRRDIFFDRGNWQPTEVTRFYWDWSENAWSTEGLKTSYKFNEKGLLAEETEGNGKHTYTYNEDGQVIEEIYSYEDENGNQVLTSKVIYEYDDVVKNFPILEESYAPDANGQLYLTWGNKFVITRNDDGNVTKVQEFYKDSGLTDYKAEDEYFTVEYDADGVATTMTLYEYDEDDNTYSIRTQLKDIIWQNTDGQILVMNDDIDDEDYYIGANRIKSALAVKADGMPDNSVITAEYPGIAGSWEASIKWGETLIWNYSMIYTDENGSFKESEKSFYVDEEDGKWVIDDDPYLFTEELVNDKFGLMLSCNTSDYSDKGEVTYDEETGLPTKYITSHKYGDEDYQNQTMYLFAGYVEAAEVKGVETTDADATPVYYDIHGLRVKGDNLPAGLYIEHRGNTARKILVK